MPYLKELDDFYKSVRTLLSVNQENIDGLNIKIKKENEEIVNISDDNYFENINNCIASLIAKGEKLVKVDLSFTDKDSKNFSDAISDGRIAAQKQVEETKDLQKSIVIAKAGNDEIIGLEFYFENQNSILANSEKLIELEKTKQKFEDRRKRSNELKQNQEQIQNNLEARENAFLINSLYPEYESITKQLAKLAEKKTLEQKNLEQGNTKLKEVQEDALALNVKLESNLKESDKTEQKIKDFPSVKEALDNIEISLKGLDTEINDLAKSIEELENSCKVPRDLVGLYDKIIKEAQSGIYSTHVYSGSELFKTEVSDLNALVLSIRELENSIADINKRIDSQNAFKSDLEKFISKGLEIANSNQSSNCPLCSHEYQSYNDLVISITQNKILDQLLQDLLNQRTELQNQIVNAKEKLTEGTSLFIEKNKKSINENNEKLLPVEEKIRAQASLVQEKRDRRAELLASQTIHQTKLEGIAIEEYNQRMNDNLKAIKELILGISSQLEEKNKSIRTLDEQIKLHKETFNVIEKELSELTNQEAIQKVIKWFAENKLTKSVSKEVLDVFIKEIESKVRKQTEEIQKLEETINQLNNELVSNTEEELFIKITRLEKQNEDLKVKTDTYKLFIKKLLNDVDFNSTKDDLLKLLNKVEGETIERQKRLNAILIGYDRLSGYNKNLLPFLRSEQSKLRVSEWENEKEFLEKEVVPLLKGEKEKVKLALEKEVKDSFYEKLINEIYIKIDPHPDFKEISFKADFDSEKPRLDVLVKNPKDENEKIPNLYFSTAQINILSLSIFLASALNSPKYDCIFIDDPVQSMDSINVLSTIDLFRSIIVNYDKQIIMSTHDENFHNLLKKKIPPQLFNSKFLELESFGKVKKEKKDVNF